jgi:hypothetical protein
MSPIFELATARSGIPSPFQSPIVTDVGAAPVAADDALARPHVHVASQRSMTDCVCGCEHIGKPSTDAPTVTVSVPGPLHVKVVEPPDVELRLPIVASLKVQSNATSELLPDESTPAAASCIVAPTFAIDGLAEREVGAAQFVSSVVVPWTVTAPFSPASTGKRQTRSIGTAFVVPASTLKSALPRQVSGLASVVNPESVIV